jgi:hypothetical protein
MAKLKQVQYDRRPSTTLRAWANPPGSKLADHKTPPKEPLDVEMETVQRHVTLGDWAAVKAYLAALPEEEAKAGYKQMLQSLLGSPGGPVPMILGPNGPMPTQYPEQNAFNTEDVLGLAAAAPRGLEKEHLASLGAILQRALTGHTVTPNVVARFKAETAKPAGKAALNTRQAARVLVAAGESAAAGDFLPTLDKAKSDKDFEALNLLAHHFLGVHAREKKVQFLEQAWTATLAVLALGGGQQDEKDEAVRRAVELAPRLKEQLGQAWLEQSFTTHPERGMVILATIGSLASQGLQTQPMNPDERLKAIQLQKTAVDALLKAAPQRAAQWKPTLSLLAGVWLKEGDYSNRMDHSTGMGPRMRRDMWGNIFWMSDDDPNYMMMMRQQNQPLPVRTGDLLRARPEKDWLALLDDGERAKLSILLANLFLKVGEDDKAFPHIEQLAGTHPEQARELVKEFLRVWTRNHDPNAARAYTNPYMWMFGFERRADGIPLTRSKQERNLIDLADLVARMRKLPLGELDDELLANAFTKCHSSAEVYRLEAIEKVFGPLKGIKPRTLAALIQQTRENLSGVWRQPAEQQDKKTNRKQKDIQREVVRGYALAGTVINDALKQFPDDWGLALARAALLHDEVNYHQEIAKSSEFSKKRDEAMAGFQKAATLYAAKLKDLSEDDESIKVYQQWFHASLGACDLQHVTEEKLPDLRQAALIRKAIVALPGAAATRHMDKMANSLFTNMSAVAPAAKHRYLKLGFEIVGDNKQAWEAKKVYDYYKDLITEIKLEAIIDGPDKVGHKQAFGLFVNIRHTREIEQESGGFGRYLQNQNGMMFSWNYGRPTTDYRDKFQTAATEALKEHFEVLSVTFQTDKVNSRATQEYGWRITPYAYLLLKPRGPQVDKIPPLRMDLDFLDTSGYVILPVESPAVPIDARAERGAPRPTRKLQITQILDERQADQGKLGLEIKAMAVGLVGNLDEILKVEPEGIEVVKADDQGLSVAKFDDKGDDNAVVSERTWLVSLRARQDRAEAPKVFRFPASRVEGAEMTYQRYQDADLTNVEAEVSLERNYEGRGRGWMWAAGSGGVGLLAVAGVATALLLRRRPKAQLGMQLPPVITPFTVTVLLRRIRQVGKLSTTDREELDRAIGALERRYFADDGNGEVEVDLRMLAEKWVCKTQ